MKDLYEKVADLLNECKEQGSYKINFSAIGGSASGGEYNNLPSGIYIVKLQAGSNVHTIKMSLLK